MYLVPAHVEGGGGEHGEHVREDGLQHRVQTRGGGVQLQAGHMQAEGLVITLTWPQGGCTQNCSHGCWLRHTVKLGSSDSQPAPDSRLIVISS